MADTSTHKKVVVRYRPSGFAEGFVAHNAWDGSSPLEILTPTGTGLRFAPEQVLALYYVADWEQARAIAAATIHGKGWPHPGTRVRIVLTDRTILEGILLSDLLDLAAGAWLAPLLDDHPYQRLYVPRSAIQRLTVVEVVREPRRRSRRSGGGAGQFGLFEADWGSPEPGGPLLPSGEVHPSVEPGNGGKQPQLAVPLPGQEGNPA